MSEILEAHISRSSSCRNKILAINSLKQSVFYIRMNPTIGLSIHGLWSQGSSNQIDRFKFLIEEKINITFALINIYRMIKFENQFNVLNRCIKRKTEGKQPIVYFLVEKIIISISMDQANL
ncbi:hypothetical protein BpHYR1_008339 [Brachionus plicatilis]|uniref:Uncharacterized protein n=1 Tax=Brachionus plicatilis TaxID=10195 RepID=A0A3M7SCF6_BRAPC|nr:hypothetical protein BpHYR1_008339 [Brachionus plicatilis]